MGPTFADILLGLAPMMLLIGAWFFLVRKMGKGADYANLERRKVEALERIASALERR